MNKKSILLMLVLTLVCFCGCNKNTPPDEAETAAVSDDLMVYFDSITDNELDALEQSPSLDEYQNSPLVLLNWYNDDVRLYGLSVEEETAMLLYIQGEKVLINRPYRNNHISYPEVNVYDADGDGKEEIFISRETMTGSPGFWYELLVCDYENEWVVCDYSDYVEDIESLIDYSYDEALKTITFLNNKDGAVLAEVTLPDWTEEYPYTGVVDLAVYIRFDAETMSMEAAPGIILENSAVPYTPIKMVFQIGYENDDFEIEQVMATVAEDYYTYAKYYELIESIRNGINYGFSQDEVDELGITPLFNYNMDFSDFGYIMMDIDGNGVCELLIGENGSGGWNGVIYDMYTLHDGEMVQLFNGADRNRYYLCDNGLIANEGSNGATSSIYVYYSYSDMKFEIYEAAIYDSYADEENPWFYSRETCDVNEMEHITADEAEQITGFYNYEVIEYIPFT